MFTLNIYYTENVTCPYKLKHIIYTLSFYEIELIKIEWTNLQLICKYLTTCQFLILSSS